MPNYKDQLKTRPSCSKLHEDHANRSLYLLTPPLLPFNQKKKYPNFKPKGTNKETLYSFAVVMLPSGFLGSEQRERGEKQRNSKNK